MLIGDNVWGDNCPSYVNPEWIRPPIPVVFRSWGRTDSSKARMDRCGWEYIPGTAWGQSSDNTWCVWDEDGVIAWMYRGDGPHWVRQPNQFPAFTITRLY